MAQVEHPDNLARFTTPAYRLVTLILIQARLRVTDALRLDRDRPSPKLSATTD